MSSINAVRTLLASMLARVQKSDGNGGHLSVPHSIEYTRDTFNLVSSSVDVGDITISFGEASSIHTVTFLNSDISVSSSSITCATTINAGGSAACTLVGINDAGALVGDAAAGPAWVITLSSAASHEIIYMKVQFQSQGRYTASAANIKTAGAYTIAGSFAGRPVPINSTGSSSSSNRATFVVLSGAVSASHTRMLCPTTSESGKPLTCVVSVKDAYGNPASITDSASITALALMPDGTPLRTDTIYGGDKGTFNVNFTTPNTLIDGTIVHVRAFYLSTPIFTSLPVDSSGGPSRTTSFVIKPDPLPLPVPCTTLQSLVDACVAQRGKWGFTCGYHRNWKKSGECPHGELFDVVSKTCKVGCDTN